MTLFEGFYLISVGQKVMMLRASLSDSTHDAVYVFDSQLSDEPFVGANQLSFGRCVVQSRWTVGRRPTTSTDRHPPICLRSMVHIELGTCM